MFLKKNCRPLTTLGLAVHRILFITCCSRLCSTEGYASDSIPSASEEVVAISPPAVPRGAHPRSGTYLVWSGGKMLSMASRFRWFGSAAWSRMIDSLTERKYSDRRLST